MKRFVYVLLVLVCFVFIGGFSAEANDLPRMAGLWSMSGEGIEDGEAFTETGTMLIESQIRADGVEVVTEIIERKVRFDADGNFKWYVRNENPENIPIQGTEVVLERDGIRTVLTLVSSTRFESSVTGGGWQDTRFVYTRPNPDAALPTIGGHTWNVTGEGMTHAGERYTVRGTATFTTIMDGNVECITRFVEESVTYDEQGRPRTESTWESTWTAADARRISQGVVLLTGEEAFDILTVNSASAMRLERVRPEANQDGSNPVYENLTYSRQVATPTPNPSSGGGGCSVGVGAPFALLLGLPLLLVLRK